LLHTLIQGVVVGLVKGGTYGLIAIGLVLVYKGSRVLNFAQAEVGTLCLYITAVLSGDRHVPYALGALTAVVAAVLITLLFERWVVRPMADASRLSVAVATIGLFGLALATEVYFFGPTPYFIPPPIPGRGMVLADVTILPSQLLAFAVIALVAAGLAAFLRYTDFGLGVLAAAQDSSAVRLMGIPLHRVSMLTWGVAGALSAIAALLIEPTITTVSPGAIGEPLFIGGLAAALLGGMTSLSGAFLGGIVVGVATSEVEINVSSGIPHIGSVVLFAIIMGVLLLRPQGLLGRVAARAEAA
jgi:branched-chain amino acid transport system permease protein